MARSISVVGDFNQWDGRRHPMKLHATGGVWEIFVPGLGEGTLYKSVIGVFIMIVLGNALNLLNVDSYWQRVAVGAVIIAAAAGDRLRSRA